MRKTIAIDMDEVLANTAQGLLDKYNNRLGSNHTIEDLGNQKLSNAYEEDIDIIKEIIFDRGFFGELEVIDDAIEVVEHLTKDYDVYIATAAMDVPTSFDAKFAWLKKYFPFLDEQNFIFCGYKGVVGTDYLIDDNPKQLKAFKGTSIMFTAHHNLEHDEFIRVNSWLEVKEYFDQQL